jgi:hypothetical protein
MKPRAPIPWERELDDVRSPQYAPRRCRVIRSVGGPVVAYDIGIPEADYIVHAANAYPRLVELLKKLDSGEYFEINQSGVYEGVAIEIRALLKELGELPPK